MLNLSGVLPVDKIHEINEYTNLRFANRNDLKTPEALSLYEQRRLPKKRIHELCEDAYGYKLYEPTKSYVPEKVTAYYASSGCVPVMYQPAIKMITVVYIPELKHIEMEYPDHKTEYLPTTLYYYLDMYQKSYGVHRILRTIPAKTLFQMITTEAIDIGASDITISSVHKSTIVYYDVRKRKVNSNYIFPREFMDDLLKLLTIKSPIDRGSRKPKAVDIDINREYRGRVMINYKFGGYTVTIRLVPNSAFETSLEELNLTPETVEWLRYNFLDTEKGLRLMVGATSSGKNTTLLALLKELVERDRYKVVSVEIPVEQELEGVEQINCNTPEDFEYNVKSLIRVNPDFVYIAEIQDSIGLAAVNITNTGKCVMSTIHANSVADTISRLIDVTGLEQDRVIQSLHSIVYQELLRDDEKDMLYPRDRYIRFTQELKYKLYGKSLGEVIQIMRDYEEGDVWTSTQRMRF